MPLTYLLVTTVNLLGVAPLPNTRAPLLTLTAKHGPVTCVVFTPRGDGLFSGDAGGRLILWHLPSSRAVHSSAPKDRGRISSLVFSPNGKRALVNYQWCGVTIRNLQGVEVRETTAEFDRLTRAGFWPRYNDWGCLSTITTVDVATGREESKVLVDGPSVSAITYSSSGQEVLVAHFQGAFQEFRGGRGKHRFTLCPEEETVTIARFTDDGRRLVTLDDGKAVRLWEVLTGKVYATLTAPASYARALDPRLYGHPYIYSTALDRYGDTVACAGGQYAVWVTDVRSGRTRLVQNHFSFKPPDKPGSVDALALSRDGRSLAVSLPDHSVQITDLTRGKSTLLRGHTGRVRAIAFSRDGKKLATGSDDRTVRLWRVP